MHGPALCSRKRTSSGCGSPWMPKSRQVMAVHVGDRSHTRAEHLWAKAPHAYRQHTTLYTDHYVVYVKVMPTTHHQAIRTLTRKTNHLRALQYHAAPARVTAGT